MKGDENETRATVSLDRDLWRRAKVQAAREDRTVGDVVDEAVREWLKRRAAR